MLQNDVNDNNISDSHNYWCNIKFESLIYIIYYIIIIICTYR